ncbi:MAG: glucose-1-phosphate thymidylyltransferase [Muribaculaceae bacterium]|nr:glucose-1-phosphate thymidylyltransferase [Muribaculaceae bacterium]
MRNIILFDDKVARENLLPMTFTRPVADMRFGITTIREKWEAMLLGRYSYLATDYLSVKYPATINKEDNIFIAGNICPNGELIEVINAMEVGCAIVSAKGLIAYRGTLKNFLAQEFKTTTMIAETPCAINMLYDIFVGNHDALIEDFNRITSGRESQPLSESNTLIGDPAMLFVEEGAVVEGAILNVKKGPIYIGKNAEVMEGCCLRGPIAFCDHAVANMGAKIYGATTLGPYCKVGGEVNNVVMIGYSNKAHDGFLGNAVIGEWCNIGGGSVASNLKNDYTEIKLWNYPAHRFLRTGLQFCGLIMGDHSKAGVNTMFNTATVLGVGVNIHGSGFPRNFVASFSESSAAGYTDVPLAKFFDIARRAMARRDVQLTDADIAIFQSIHSIADNYK